MKVVPAETALGIALSQVDPERAIPQLESALALSREHGNESMEFSSGSVLAHVLVSQGELVSALELYDSLLDRGLDTRNQIWTYLICESLGTSPPRKTNAKYPRSSSARPPGSIARSWAFAVTSGSTPSTGCGQAWKQRRSIDASHAGRQ
jgi:hypothetical protein